MEKLTRESLSNIIQFFSEYFSIFPFPNLSQQILNAFPKNISEIRRIFRENLHLPQDNIDQYNNKLNEASKASILKSHHLMKKNKHKFILVEDNQEEDEELLLNILEETYEKLSNGSFFKDTFRKITKIIVNPIFKIELEINLKILKLRLFYFYI